MLPDEEFGFNTMGQLLLTDAQIERSWGAGTVQKGSGILFLEVNPESRGRAALEGLELHVRNGCSVMLCVR